MEEQKEFLEDGVTPNPDLKKEEVLKGEKGKDDKPTTFTQEDLDRIAAKTRSEAKAIAEKEKKEAIAQARQEALDEAKLSEEEKTKKVLARQQQETADREKAITIRENRAAAIEKFAELKLPTKLVDFVVSANAEVQDKNISDLKRTWDESMKEALTAQMKGKAPIAVGNNNNGKGSDAAEPKQYF